MRMCAACRARLPKSEMVRIALDTDGVLAVDTENDLRGRGINICPREECFENAWVRKMFDKTWKGVQQTSSKEQVTEEFRKLLERRAFRGGKDPVSFRIAKTDAEAQVGHTITRTV